MSRPSAAWGGRGPGRTSSAARDPWASGAGPGRGTAGSGPSPIVLGVVLLTAALFVGWVWLTGEVAGLVARGGWPSVPVRAAPGVAVRLPARLGAPRTAWPQSAQGELPDGVGIDIVGAGLGLLATGLLVTAWRAGWVSSVGARWRSFRMRAPKQTIRTGGAGRTSSALSPWRLGRAPRGAHWATGRELVALRPGRGQPGRLVIGTAGRRRVATESRHSVLVIGPTQSGKTTGLAVPAILEWDGPMVATSVKDDLADVTIGWRRKAGECWVFDPTATSGLRQPAGWSPLAGANDWSSAQRMAAWLVEATPARTGLSDSAFWYSAAAKQLSPLLLAASLASSTMAEVVRWNNLGDFDAPARILDVAGELDASVALAACAARDDRIRSSVTTTLDTVLTPFEDPVVAANTAVSDIDPARLLEGTNSLYLCGPSHEQSRVQGLFASLVSTVVAEAVAQVNRTGRPLDPPLLVVLDEAANIAPIRDLDTLASTGAGLGIQLVTVVQDLAQLANRYGPDRSRTIANNHRAKVILSGMADLTTLDLLSGLVGEAAIREETVTHDLRDGRKTRSAATTFRRLAPTDELRRIPPGTGILVYGHLPPVRVRLRPWYRDRHLRARAAVTGPQPGLTPAAACAGSTGAPGGSLGA